MLKKVISIFALLIISHGLCSHTHTPCYKAVIGTIILAFAGKNKDFIREKLKDVGKDGLYSFQPVDEAKHLVAIISNIEEVRKKDGYRSVAKTTDKKSRAIVGV